jgi:hypothetical protein
LGRQPYPGAEISSRTQPQSDNSSSRNIKARARDRQELVARLTDALERADLDALIEPLVTDVRFSMPPAMLEYRGIESAQRLLAAVTFRPGRTYRVVPTRANGQPAFGLYLADPTLVSTGPTPSWSSLPPATTSPPSPASTPTS